jgi:hypothetical protein
MKIVSPRTEGIFRSDRPATDQVLSAPMPKNLWTHRICPHSSRLHKLPSIQPQVFEREAVPDVSRRLYGYQGTLRAELNQTNFAVCLPISRPRNHLEFRRRAVQQLITNDLRSKRSLHAVAASFSDGRRPLSGNATLVPLCFLSCMPGLFTALSCQRYLVHVYSIAPGSPECLHDGQYE